MGSFGVSAIYAPQNRDRVELAIREELARALAQGFTDAEFEAAKQGLLEARRVQRGQDGALAGRLANYLYLGRTFAWDVELERQLAALHQECAERPLNGRMVFQHRLHVRHVELATGGPLHVTKTSKY